jgi:hypothetical protein
MLDIALLQEQPVPPKERLPITGKTLCATPQAVISLYLMTCYFRHLGKIFVNEGIIITKENIRKVDQIIRGIVDTAYTDCPGTWQEVKKRLAENEVNFVKELKEAWIKVQIEEAEK